MSDTHDDVVADDMVPAEVAASAEPARGDRRVAPWVAGLVAVVLAALFAVLLVNRGSEADSAETPLLNQPAPAVSGTLADGTTFELSRRKGSWVVLNFFRHDCIPCIVEHPELIEFVDQQRALGTQGAEFYTVVQHSTREEVDAFFASRGGDWPIVYDDDFAFQVEFGVAQVPETWLIDPNGFVRGRIITTVTADNLSRTIQSMREALP